MSANNLAAAFLAGSWSLSGLVNRGAQASGRRERWLRPLAAAGRRGVEPTSQRAARRVRPSEGYPDQLRTQNAF
jgi:hypothetical protein